MAERTHSVRLRLIVDQLRQDAADAAKSISGIGAAATGAGAQSKALDKLGDAARGFGRSAAVVGTVAAGALAALSVSVIRTGISYNSLEQNSRAALTTLLGGADAATEQMDKLREFVRTALFPREAFIEAQQNMLAFGFSAERVIPIMSALQDAIAATGGSAQTFQEVVGILSRVQSTGEITAGTLNELGRRGINAAQLIGQAMGKSENEIRTSITRGTLDARDAIEVLVSAMETRFAGAAELISNTWVGASGLVTAALRDIGSALVEPFIDPLGGGAAVQWARDLADVLYALEGQVRTVVGLFRTSAEPTFQSVSDRLQQLAERIAAIDIEAVIDQVSAGAPAIVGFGAAAATAGSGSVLAALGMGRFAAALNPVTAGIAAATLVSPELRDVLFEILETLAPLVPVVIDAGEAMAGALSTGLTVVAALLDLVMPLVQALVEAFGLLPGPIQTAVIALGGFALALRFAGPVGIALTALAALGAVVETVKGESIAASISITDLAEDLERLGERGRVTGELWRLFGEDSEFFAEKLEQATSTIGKSDDALTRFVESIGLGIGDIEDARERFQSLDEGLAELVRSGEDAEVVMQALIDTYGLSAEQVEQLTTILPEFTNATQRQAEATKDAAEDQQGFATSTGEATAALREQADTLRAAADPMFALHKATRDLEEAQAHYDEVLQDSESTQKDVEDALVALTDAAINMQGAAGDAAGTFDGKLSPAMRATLEAAGLTEEQIDGVEAAFRRAQKAGDKFAKRYEAEVHTSYTESGRPPPLLPGTGVTRPGPQLAAGGPVAGPAGLDRVPAWLTRDEHVWTVREVQAAGGHEQVEALRAAVLAGQTRFASGGPVGVPRMQAGGRVTAEAMTGEFRGALYLDSGQFLGVVQGEIGRGHEHHDRELRRRFQQGVGAAQ